MPPLGVLMLATVAFATVLIVAAVGPGAACVAYGLCEHAA